MKKQNMVIGIFIGLVLLAGSFYGGMQYGTKNVAAKNQLAQAGRNFGGGVNGGQRMNRQGGSVVPGGAGANNEVGDFTGGEIISKDDSSVTIKTRDGGSRIVFFSDKTSVDKSVSGSVSDLSVGQQVMINGRSNSDGSFVAQNIQIRPFQASANPVRQ